MTEKKYTVTELPAFLSGTCPRPCTWGLDDAFGAAVFSQTLLRDLMRRVAALDGGPATPEEMSPEEEEL